MGQQNERGQWEDQERRGAHDMLPALAPSLQGVENQRQMSYR